MALLSCIVGYSFSGLHFARWIDLSGSSARILRSLLRQNFSPLLEYSRLTGCARPPAPPGDRMFVLIYAIYFDENLHLPFCYTPFPLVFIFRKSRMVGDSLSHVRLRG